MADLKDMTVQALRDLARKALGRGHSKHRTKSDLIEALQAAEKKVTEAAGKAASKVKRATGRAARATEKVMESVRGKQPAPSRAKAAGGKAPRERKREEPAKASVRPERRGAAAAASKDERERRPGRAAAGPEPDPEGFMVARVAGEDAAHGAPHPFTERTLEAEPPAKPARPPPPSFEEDLGELPAGYGDDVLIALPRDPRTLFLYWDHAHDTLRAAWEGLEGGRPQLWIFCREPDGGWTRVRVLDIALESRSYYIHDLEPGRVYRAEVHLVDRQGRERLVPRASNEMMLPPIGPSPIVDDRFMRIVWGEPLQRLLRETHAGGAFPEDVRQQLARLSDWSLFAGRVWGGSAGGIGGRPFSAVSSPSSPSSPWGHGEGEGR